MGREHKEEPRGGFETLIGAQALAENIHRQDWVVVDCRFDLADTDKGEHAYRQTHIPGARYAHLDRDLSGPVTAVTGRHPLPDSGVFARWLGAQGIHNRSQVVAYDDLGGSMAVRLWWLMRWLGHRRVAVLDGGFQAWRDAGLVMTADVPDPEPAVFKGVADQRMIVHADALMQQKAGRVLIDVRTAERFRGEAEPIDPVAGRIPGAVNVPWPENLGTDGRFLPAATLRGRYKQATGLEAEERVLMCGSGVTACFGILALEVAGIPGARLYAGSWSEWIRDPRRPIMTGEG